MSFQDCAFVDDETTIVCCVSGGKDSTAMMLHLRDLKLPNPIRYIHNDTGHEHPITVAYIQELRDSLGIDIEVSKGPYTFEALAIKKGCFPSTRRRFCTEQLKVIPMKHFLDGKRWVSANSEQPWDGEWIQIEESLDNAVLAVGVRKQESHARSQLGEWDEDGKAYDRPVWRPLIDWSAEQVFDIHRKHGVKWNPLYEMGFRRVGCWPCINTSKGQLRRSFKEDPSLLGRLREMEARVAAASKHGTASIFPSDKVPRRFHDKKTPTNDGRTITFASIDGIHEWCFEGDDDPRLFDMERDGCMSQYGLCE